MNQPQDAMKHLINTLADQEDGVLPFDVVVALQPLMAPALWAELANAWEVCPTHLCDEQICADDNADCLAGEA